MNDGRDDNIHVKLAILGERQDAMKSEMDELTTRVFKGNGGQSLSRQVHNNSKCIAWMIRILYVIALSAGAFMGSKLWPALATVLYSTPE